MSHFPVEKNKIIAATLNLIVSIENERKKLYETAIQEAMSYAYSSWFRRKVGTRTREGAIDWLGKHAYVFEWDFDPCGIQDNWSEFKKETMHKAGDLLMSCEIMTGFIAYLSIEDATLVEKWTPKKSH